MRSVPRRPAAVLLAGLVALGVAGVTRVATAESVPAAALAKPQPKAWPMVRPAAEPTGADPVRLEVELTSAADEKADAARVGKLSAASAVSTVPVKGPDQVVVTVRADAVKATLAKLRNDSTVASAKVAAVYRASDVTPNDEFYGYEHAWNLADVKLPAAWNTTTGTPAVTVAVIDSGVSNVSELSGALLPGYDFVNNDSNASDDYGHGTMVASLVAGSTNNGANISSACWTCRILPVKVLDDEGNGTSAWVAKGIDFAVSKKVHIINLSLGGESDDPQVRDAIARAAKAHITVIAAAGNAGSSVPEYPAANNGVISVGATQSAAAGNAPYDWSNYGRTWVDLAAPGEATMQAQDGEVYFAEGTSFAAPLVAGVAALIKSAHPAANDYEIYDALMSTATGGDANFKYGRVDAARAVTKMAFTGSLAPQIRIAGPGNTTLKAPTNVSVMTGADVVSVVGTDGAVQLSDDRAAPWVVNWKPNGNDGWRNVMVTATARNGQKSTASIALLQDRVAPVIAGVTPGENTKQRGTITVGLTSVTEAYGIAKAELVVDGKSIGTDTTSPYAVKYDLSKRNGTVKLQWRVIDRAGNSGYYTRTIIADNTVPTVKITSGPANNATVSGTVKLKVSASDTYGVNRVELLINDAKVATDTTNPYEFSIAVANYGTKLKVQVRAYDSAGNVAYDTTRNWRR